MSKVGGTPVIGGKVTLDLGSSGNPFGMLLSWEGREGWEKLCLRVAGVCMLTRSNPGAVHVPMDSEEWGVGLVGRASDGTMGTILLRFFRRDKSMLCFFFFFFSPLVIFYM